MKNIRKYMMAAACMTAAAALVACTEAVKRDTEEEIQEMTVPKKPGPITKVPATLTCNGGEEFTFGFEGSVGRDLRMDDRRAGEVENLDHRRSGNQRHHR